MQYDNIYRNSIEMSILSTLIFRPEYQQKVLPYLKATFFEQDRAYQLAFRLIDKHFKRYDTAPTPETLLADLHDSTDIVQGDVEPTTALISHLEQDKQQDLAWLLDRTEQFCRQKSVYRLIQDAVGVFGDDKESPELLQKIKKIWEEAEPVSFNNEVQATLMQTSGDFVADFKPPDYLIDGLLQRRYVYSLTGPTGSGKTAIALRIAGHVALGRPLGSKGIEKGKVLVFAGENPDDVRTRWIKMCEVLGKVPSEMDVIFLPGTPNISACAIRAQIDKEAAKHGPFALVIVDTSAAYYTGDNENDNVQLGKHARMLRTLVDLPGGPTILVTCHPTKTPNMDNLLPRGGGAFLAEVDGNLACIADHSTKVVEINTHGKFRGPEFSPLSFKLIEGTSDQLRDTKGGYIRTIYCELLTSAEEENISEAKANEQAKLLDAIRDNPGASLAKLAGYLFWMLKDGEPNKMKVKRMCEDLIKAKLVEKSSGGYVLSKKAQKAA
jgi:hypothetical protein